MLRYTRFRPEKRTTLRGFPFTVYKEEPLMPRIDDRYLDCSAYLYPTQLDAGRGQRIGGTGFLVAVPAFGNGWLIEGGCLVDAYHHCYVVSNRHVAEKHPVVRLNTHDGRFDVIPFTAEDWTFSKEHDLAAVQIEYNRAHKYLFISTSSFLDKKIMSWSDVGIGDEVFMVGRFISHDGTQQNSPLVRWGHISMMPSEPIYHASNSSRQQEGFLVEIHSISGYSGSPVFVRPFPTQKLPAGSVTNTTVTEVVHFFNYQPVGGGPWLLGVEWGYVNSHDQWANNSGISGVVPAWFLLDLLNTPKLKALRMEEQQRLAERVRRGGTTLT